MNKRLLQLLFFVLCHFVGGTVFAQGSDFQFVKMDGSAKAVINSVAYTSNGDYVYVGGWIEGAGGTSFPTTAIAADGKNGLVAKYASDGTLIWAFNVGGTGVEEVTAVAVDGNGDLIVGGYFTSTFGTDFSGVSGGNTSLGSTGGKDVFLAKYTSAGILTWVNQGTSSNDDQINDIAIDASNNIFVAGTSYGNFSYGGSTASQGGGGDGFAMRVLSSGSLFWMRTLDTTGEDEFLGVTVFNGFAYFGGYYSGTRTFYLLGIIPLGVSSTGGSADLVIAKIDALNGELDELETFSGTGEDKIFSLANDGTDLYFTGSTIDGLSIGSDSYTRTNKEIVTAKLDEDLNRIWSNVTTQTGSGSSVGKDVDVLPDGQVVVSGAFSGTLNAGYITTATSAGGTDGIILTYDGTINWVLQQIEVPSSSDVAANSISVKNNIEIFVAGTNMGATTFAPLGTFSATSTEQHPFVAMFGCTPATAVISGGTTICIGASTDLTFTFTGSAPYDFSYSDGTTTFNETGITTATHTISVTPSSTKTYSLTAFSSAGCASTYSGSATINVGSEVTNNVIYGDTTHCGASASYFTGTVPDGGGSTGVTYYWQYKNVFNNWVGGVNTNNQQNYNSSSVFFTVEYRRQVSAPGCPTSTSNVVTATILNQISSNNISGDQQACGDFDPIVFSASSPNGGDGNYTYTWERDSNANFSTPSSEAASSVFDETLINQTFYYRRIVESSVCKDTSDTVVVEIDPEITNNTISSNQAFCGPAVPLPFTTVAVSGGDNTFAFIWQSSPDQITWSNVGANEGYSPGSLNATTYFRRIVNSGFCSDTSNIVTVAIQNPISANSISASGSTTICQDSTVEALIGSTPIGGDNATYTYLWEESNDNSTWSVAAGTNNAIDYAPTAQTSIRYYRRKASSGACLNDISNVLTISVYPPITNNSISANETICANTSPALLTGTTPTGGDGGTITYQWFSSTDNVSFNSISGANSIDYQPTVLASTSYFTRRVTRGPCGDHFSDTVTITVQPAIANNSITTDQNLCSGESATKLDGSFATGGTGTMLYTWYSSTDSSTWMNIATTQDYVPGVVTQTTHYFRTVVSGTCTISDSSNVVTITVFDPVSVNSISANHNVCSGNMPDLLVGSTAIGGGGTISYSWISSSDNVNWVAASGTASGIDFQPSSITDTTYYRRIATGSTCPADSSNTVQVSVEDLITNNTLTAPSTICSNDASAIIDGALPQNGNGVYTYQWQESSDDITWISISGAVNEDLSIGAISNNTYYRRIVTSGECGADTSASVLQSVDSFITTNTISSDQVICYDSIPNVLTGAVQSPGVFSFTWQESADSTIFADAIGVNSNNTYQASNLTATTFYQRIIHSGVCPNDTSNILKIEVIPLIADNTISADTTVCFGSTAITIQGSSPMGGDGNYDYAWEYSTDGILYSSAIGTSASNLSNFSTGILNQTTYFRRIVISTPCGNDSLISNIVTITVEAALSANTISADQVLCGNYNVSTLTGSVVTGGNGTPDYQWQSSIDLFVWNDEVTTQDYSPGTISDTMYYRRKVTSGSCLIESVSDTVTVIYLAPISSNVIASSDTICTGDAPSTFTDAILPPAGGDGTYSYTWEQSADNLTWISAGGSATASSFDAAALSDTTYFRRIVGSNVCFSDTSNTVEVIVEDDISNNIVTIPGAICSNDASGTIDGSLPLNGNGVYAYQWQESSDDITWVSISGAVNEDLSIGAISNNTYYRRIVTSGECGADTSASVLQSVDPLITTNTISSDQVICYDSIPNVLTGAVQSPGVFSFTWQESADSTIFADASGVNSNNTYQASNLTATTFYQRIIHSGVCPNDTSNILKIEVIPLIADNTISADTTVCFGSTAITIQGSSPMGGDGNYDYAWEYSTDGILYSSAIGTSASNLSNFSTGILNQTTYFRRIVISTPCGNDSLISNIVTITVEAALSANTISADQVLCGNYNVSTLTGSVVTGGNGTPDYQWQSSADLSTWTNEVTTQDYTPGTISDTMYYRRKVTSGSCLIESISDTVTAIYLAPISSNNIQSNDTICIGDAPATFTDVLLSPAGGNGTYSYTWEQSSDNVTWSSALGTATGSSFDADPLLDTTYFRRIVGSSVCFQDTSNTLIVIVEDVVGNNAISIPSDVCSSSTSDSIFGTAPTGGNTVYSYQWQVYDSTLVAWINAPGMNTNQDYALGTITDSAYFRRIISSGQCGADTSVSILVAVQPAINTNTIAADEFICLNTAPQNLTGTLPAGFGFVYTWESSTDGVNYTLETTGSNAQDFQPGTLDTTTFYRRIITSGVCTADTSNMLTITVWDSLSNNSILDDTTICFGADPVVIMGSTIAGGSGNFIYQWEESTDGVNFSTPSANFSSSNYTSGVLSQTTYFRRRVTDADCVNDTLFSNTVLVTVHSKITHDYTVIADTLCIGDDLDVEFQLTGDGPFMMSYNNNGNPSTITNITGPLYNVTITPSATGMIIVDTLWDVHGCQITPKDTFNYRVVTYPVVDLGIDSTVCDEYIFNPSFGSGSLVFSSPTLGVLDNSFPLAYSPSTFGSHQLILEETVENCANSDTVEITFEESIGFITAGDDISIVLQDSTNLYASELLPNQTGYWTLISGGGSFSDSSDPNAIFLDLISGVSVLEWTVEQSVCPSSSDQLQLVVENLFVPTGFSPNGDGNNDYLEIAGREDINTINIQVFDRWGGLVFSDKDYQNDWYGTTNSGEDLPEDTYFVIVDLGEKGIHKSYLMIRR